MLIRRPDLLAFDDLSSALDVETESLLWQRLFESNPNTTILAVSHHPTALSQAHQIPTLEGGRLI